MTSPAYDVIVAGLGAMGSATAWQLARRGLRVLGLDRWHPPHAMGSSTGETRIIREAYFESPFYVPMVRRAYHLWTALEVATGEKLLTRTGGLSVGPRDGPLVSGAIASAEVHGVPFEVLDPASIRDRFPLQPHDGVTGVWDPGAGVLRPEECIRTLLSQAGHFGATLRYDEPVLRWEATPDQVVVTTGSGRYTAARLVLASGAWLGQLQGGAQVPLTVARQIMLWLTARRPERFGPDRCPIWLWETGEGPVYYGFPDMGTGPKVAQHHGGQVVDPDTVNREVDYREADGILRFLAGAVPDLTRPVRQARVCLYSNTPDEHFILDRHPAHHSVIVASPCSGHGFKFAPTVGEILADLVLDQSPSFDLTPFRLDRFGTSRSPMLAEGGEG